MQWGRKLIVTDHYIQQNAAICTQIQSAQTCVKSSVNTSTHSGVNNCRYLLQRREQWCEASPQILKALSVSGTANRKSNLLCHTETCLTTLNNCTAALERAVFLLSNEGLQGREQGCVCFVSVCVFFVCACIYVHTVCMSGDCTKCQHIYLYYTEISGRGMKKILFWSNHVPLLLALLPHHSTAIYWFIESACCLSSVSSSRFEAVIWFNNAEAGWRKKIPVPGPRH